MISPGMAELSKTEVAVPVTVDASFVEGANGLWVYATAGRLEGRDRVDVIRDGPPPAPVLDVGFGDGSLVVTVGGVEDADLDRYMLYASTEPFAASDYASGGPEDFNPEDGLELPVTVSARPGEPVEVTLSPLDNGVSYTIGARAVDASGRVRRPGGQDLDVVVERAGVTCAAREDHGTGGTDGRREIDDHRGCCRIITS